MNQVQSNDPVGQAVIAHAAATLPLLADKIDREGFYPQALLHELGRLGGFGASAGGEAGIDLTQQIAITTQVGSFCGSTAFLLWCQSTCVWYLQYAPESAVRKRYLRDVASTALLAGSGMSNALKHLAGIEKIRLHAWRDDAGYVVDGVLPWVSNLGPGHLLIAAAAVEGGGYVMFAVPGSAPGLSLHDCPAFAGMEGTRTFNVRLHDVAIGRDAVLAHPAQFAAFMQRIKPGFVLGQAAMAFGVVQGSLKTIRESNVTLAHVNMYLRDQEADLRAALDGLQAEALALAQQAQEGAAPLLPVLRLRARASGLALRAANSAVLHAGARGYVMRHPAQRQLREAVFAAIVTPALKHLRKEIADLEGATHKTEAA